MLFVTGDTHRDFSHVQAFYERFDTTKDDILIVLGDAGINYFGGAKDHWFKMQLEKLPLTLFCIHGNHEQRPATLGYTETDWHGGIVYTEPEFPSLLFAKDGEIYELGGKMCIAIGGAYSVDKPYRIANNWGWWNDEQPDDEIKRRVEARLDAEGWEVDVVLSHTCPLKYEPRETFIQGIDESGVDKSTEQWLDSIEDRLEYGRWLCGHFHINKVIDRLRFMATDIREFV